MARPKNNKTQVKSSPKPGRQQVMSNRLLFSSNNLKPLRHSSRYAKRNDDNSSSSKATTGGHSHPSNREHWRHSIYSTKNIPDVSPTHNVICCESSDCLCNTITFVRRHTCTSIRAYKYTPIPQIRKSKIPFSPRYFLRKFVKRYPWAFSCYFSKFRVFIFLCFTGQNVRRFLFWCACTKQIRMQIKSSLFT